MIKILSLLIPFFFLFSTNIWGQTTTTIRSLTEDTSPTSDDLIYVVNDPLGVPGDRKVQLGNVPKAWGAVTWGAGSGFAWTFNASAGTDPIITFGDGTINVSTGTFQVGGVQVRGIVGAAVQNKFVIGNATPAWDVSAWTLPASLTSGDIPYATGANTLGVLAKPANNSLLGIDNAGNFTGITQITPVLTTTFSADHSYSGTVIVLTAGEALTQFDIVYCKNKAGVHACYKYDRNGADKAMPPRFMATADISADATGTFLVMGTVRHDGFGQTTNQDEGKIVYASATAGGIDLTKPSTTGDMVAILGYVLEENKIYFNPSPILVEVP